jgi:hypothetical protein
MRLFEGVDLTLEVIFLLGRADSAVGNASLGCRIVLLLHDLMLMVSSVMSLTSDSLYLPLSVPLTEGVDGDTAKS